MSEQVVLLCSVNDDGKMSLLDAVVDLGSAPTEPESLWRAEKAGWVAYRRTDLWLPRQDGVFSRLAVYVNDHKGSVSQEALMDFILETFNAPQD